MEITLEVKNNPKRFLGERVRAQACGLKKTLLEWNRHSRSKSWAEKKKAYTTTTERKSFGELFWTQRKTFQAGGGYKNPIKTRKTMSTTEIFPLWTPLFSGKKSSALEQGGVCFLFPSWDRAHDLSWRSPKNPYVFNSTSKSHFSAHGAVYAKDPSLGSGWRGGGQNVSSELGGGGNVLQSVLSETTFGGLRNWAWSGRCLFLLREMTESPKRGGGNVS